MTEEKLMQTIQDLYNEDPENFLLVEVGANDGYCCDRMHDFILKNDPNSILIEPIPCYFEKLKDNYKHLKNLSYENVAISNKEGERTMYYIPRATIDSEQVRFRLENQPNLWKEHWAGGLGSFYHGVNNLGCPELKKFEEKTIVKTVKLKTIANKYNLTKYKNIVLQTDTEGHDYEILKDFDFSLFRPRIYICEIYGKTRYPESHPLYNTGKGIYTQTQEDGARKILTLQNYSVFSSGDMVGIDLDLKK